MDSVQYSYPSTLRYNEPLVSLPKDIYSYNTSSVPTNGSVFYSDSNNQIEVTLNKQEACVVPDSFTINYTLTLNCASAGTTASTTPIIKGTPVYTPILSLQTLYNGIGVENINNYNQIMNMVTNLHLDTSQKFSAIGYGYSVTDTNTSGAASLANNFNARKCGSLTEKVSLSAPLSFCLSNTVGKKMIPLFGASNFRLVFTLDSLANILTYGDTAVRYTGNYNISNFSISYELFQPGYDFRNELLLSPIQFKTVSFNMISQPVTASQGTQNLQYNASFTSIKSLFLLFAQASSATYVNGNFDSIDITNNNGDVQFIIGTSQYPQKPMSFLNNKNEVYSHLRKASTALGMAFTNIYDKNNCLAIEPSAFQYKTGDTTASSVPGKFICSQHVQKVFNENLLWSGVSSVGSGINVRLNSNTTPPACSASLICVYDMLIILNLGSGQLTVMQ